MNETLKMVLSLSMSASILVIILFALKPFIRHKLSKTVQYYLWIVVLLRLVLPFSFETNMMNELFSINEGTATTSSMTVDFSRGRPAMLFTYGYLLLP